MPSPSPPPDSVPDVEKAQESEPTPTTASTSVKRDRSTTPAQSESGRDAKRPNLGDMTNAEDQGSPEKAKSDRGGEPVQPAMDDNQVQKLEVATDAVASAPR